MKLDDLYNNGKTYNFRNSKNGSGTPKQSSQINVGDALDLTQLSQNAAKEGVRYTTKSDLENYVQTHEKETGSDDHSPVDFAKQEQTRGRVTYRHDMDADSYGDLQYNPEYQYDNASGTMQYPKPVWITQSSKDVRLKRQEDPNYPEVPSQQKDHGNYGVPSQPYRSGNQQAPPSKLRHRRFMGIPGYGSGLTS